MKCENGRRCGAGKVPPCPNAAIHWIVWGGGEPIKLCDRCFQVALAAGLIDEPYIGEKEANRRERQRTQSLAN